MPEQSPEAPKRKPRGDVTVVAVLREPLQFTLRFVAWYLELGAARLDLYFDDPNDPAIALLETVDRVSATRCTPEFWRSIGVDPETRFGRRQNRALTHAYKTARTAWVLNVDADELLWLGGSNLRRYAARQPEEVRAVRIQPAEAAQTDAPDDQNCTWFRVPMRPRHLQLVYGEDQALFRGRAGMVGHTEGKSMIRTGLNVSRVRQHWAVDTEGKPIVDKVVGKRQQALILHFLDNGYEHWRRKVNWRAGSSGFSRRLRQMFADANRTLPNEADYRDLYRRLHHFDEARLERLRATGRMLRLELDFDEPRQRLFA